MKNIVDLDLHTNMWINIKKLHEDAIIPVYAKFGDAGMDLTAVSKEIDKNGNASYGTGLAMELPFGYAGFIFPRSSVSKYNLDLANAVGVIDSGYRGEIICKFKPTPRFNASIPNTYQNSETVGNETYDVGDRVAQIIIIPLPRVKFSEVEELTDTERGDGGFGSSGVK